MFQGDGLKMIFYKRRGQGRKYDFEGLLILNVNFECEILKERLDQL